MEEEHIQSFQSLNPHQLDAYNLIMQSVQNNEGKLFFVYGPGGTGKTHLWKTIIAKIKSDGGIPFPTASSGIAAILLPRGRTAHSRFKIPLKLQKDSTCSISKKENLRKLIQAANLIMWDEAPTDHRHAFKAVSETLQDLMDGLLPDAKHRPFGGKTVVLVGDFRQCLPVIPKTTRDEVVGACINRSALWNDCILLELKTNMRLFSKSLTEEKRKEVQGFADWVQRVCEGTAPGTKLQDNEDGTWIKIPEDILIPNGPDAIRRLIEEIYPNFPANLKNSEYLTERAIY